MIWSESRWHWDDEHTFIHVYPVLGLAQYGIRFNKPHCDSIIPMVPVVRTRSFCQLVRVPSIRWHDLRLQLQSTDPSASHILGCVFQVTGSQVITLQVFSFSAGPGRQVRVALAESLALITHTPNPFTKHTQISYVGNFWSALPVPQQLSTAEPPL